RERETRERVRVCVCVCVCGGHGTGVMDSDVGVCALQAFGVGAMEEDDDEEVYHKDAMSNYDTILGGEEPGDGLLGWTAPQQYKKKKKKNGDTHTPTHTPIQRAL